MKKQFTFTIYAEYQIQLFQKITLIFSRKKINIKSFNFSNCEVDQIARFTIVVTEATDVVQNLVPQLERIIEVFKCFCNTNEEITSKQLALFKIPTAAADENLSYLLKKWDVKAICREKEYTVFQAIGNANEIDALVLQFSRYNLIEFIKSPTIALIKNSSGFGKHLSDMEKEKTELFQ